MPFACFSATTLTPFFLAILDSVSPDCDRVGAAPVALATCTRLGLLGLASGGRSVDLCGGLRPP